MNECKFTGKIVTSFFLFIYTTCFLSVVCSSLSAQEPDFPLCSGNEKAGAICSFPLTDVHPTQFSVGMVQVLCNKEKIEKKSLKKLKKYLRKKKNHLPAIISPDKKFYITDGHHRCAALLLAKTDQWLGKEQHIMIQVTRNDSHDNITVETFWERMLETRSVFPYDEEGNIVRNFGNRLALISIGQLRDDPYRTLSGWIREGCGYIKKSDKACATLNGAQEPTGQQPFIEQFWALYLRDRIEMKSDINAEQLWQLYPEAMQAVLDKKQASIYFSNLGFDPEEYGQNQTGGHLWLKLSQKGCVKRTKAAD